MNTPLCTGGRNDRVNRSRGWLSLTVALSTAALTGCRRSPTFNILGSFFPAWLFCLVAGIILAVVANRLFVHFLLDKEIFWPVGLYPCIALFSACALWLIFFG